MIHLLMSTIGRTKQYGLLLKLHNYDQLNQTYLNICQLFCTVSYFVLCLIKSSAFHRTTRIKMTNKLFRASKDFVKKSDDHCLVLYLNKDRSAVEAVGDNIWVKAAMENEDLFARLNAALLNACDDREPLQAL